ncbi:MAG: Hpt domain-containing protein [Bdellovibrionota bacterium]|jgi:HPt (histidine-containing phosphotransfer) domain-containing protein
MKEIQETWPKDSKAFLMLMAELEEQCSKVRELLSACSDTMPSTWLKTDFCQEFHKIKGAAGMFGLSQIAELAAQLETIFEAPLIKTIERNFEIKALLEQIELSIKDLKSSPS